MVDIWTRDEALRICVRVLGLVRLTQAVWLHLNCRDMYAAGQKS